MYGVYYLTQYSSICVQDKEVPHLPRSGAHRGRNNNCWALAGSVIKPPRRLRLRIQVALEPHEHLPHPIGLAQFSKRIS